MRTQRARRFALCGLFTAGLIPSVGAAQTSAVSAQDAAVRRQLISDAQRASQAGNHEQAMNLAERASQIEMTPSLRLFLAQESNTLRRHVVALGHADLCLREIGAMPTLNNRQRIIDGCTAAQTAANAAIGRVLVRMPNPAPGGATVTINGTTVNPATWGVATPVDPGTIRVVARATGMEPFELELNVASGQEQPVNVVFRAVVGSSASTSTSTNNATNTGSSGSASSSTNTASAGSSSGVATTVASNNSNVSNVSNVNNVSNVSNAGGDASNVTTHPAVTPEASHVDRPPPRSNAGPWALIGVGGAATIATVIGVWGYANNLAKYTANCMPNPDGACDITRMDVVSRYADDTATFSVIGWVSGVIAVGSVAGGVGWMLSNNSANARTWVAPLAVRGGAGLLVGGAL